MPVPAVERRALVARETAEILLGFHRPERLGIEQVVFIDVHRADRQSFALLVDQVLRGQGGLEDLFKLMGAGILILIFIVIVVPTAAASIAIAVVILHRRTRFMERQEREVGFAIRLAGRFLEDVRLGPIRALERIPGDPALGVLMLQRDDQLLGRVVRCPFLQEWADLRDVFRHARRGDGLLGFRQRQVVDQAEAVSLLDGADLVLAIGVERGVVDVEGVVVGVEIDDPLLAFMPDNELAPLVRGRKNDVQRGDHAVELLAIAMG